MPNPASETLDRIYQRIAVAAPAGVWSRADFLDIASPTAVEKALQRLTTRGIIRRAHRGLYDKPTVSKLTRKMVFPPRASFVDAIARRDKLRILVDGMTAANDLGLTTAVPARSTIHADTYPRTIEIVANKGDPASTEPVIYKLDFKRIAAKTAFWAGRPAMRVVQALSWFREDRGNLESVADGIVRRLVKSPERRTIGNDLRDNIHAVSAWMYPVVERIAGQLLTDSTKEQTSENGHHAAGIH